MREPIVNIAVNAARAAGNLILRAQDRLDSLIVGEKKNKDVVADIHQQIEREIATIIRKAHPNHAILGEEGGDSPNNEYTWIIDPIDGTRNFIHGLPQFAVSIAIRKQGKIEHGVIYDPIRQELFSATRGKGARVNDRRIRVSQCSKLEDALLGTGYPTSRVEEQTEYYTQVLRALLPVCGEIRQTGASALDLAYVASGRLDGFFDVGLKLWNIAAGTLLIKEAGGLTCDKQGGEDFLKTGSVVTGNPKLLKLLFKVIQPHMNRPAQGEASSS